MNPKYALKEPVFLRNKILTIIVSNEFHKYYNNWERIVDSIYHMHWNIKIALKSLIELENFNVTDVIA